MVKTAAFGAFISLLPGRDGLLHISKVGDGKRVDQVEDFLNVGDKVEVRDRGHRRPRQDLPGQGPPGGRRGAGRRPRPPVASVRPAATAATGVRVTAATASAAATGAAVARAAASDGRGEGGGEGGEGGERPRRRTRHS